jgi:uncharacterized protein GlcG (DUF336 family)
MTVTTTSVSHATISLTAAQRVVAAGLAKADEIGAPSTVAVIDASGILKALVRGDGSPLMSVDLSQRKAYTAVSAGGVSSANLFEFATQVPALLATLPHQPGLALLGGGVPLVDGQALIGAVGVSGGSPEQDVEVAEAAAAALET